MPIKHYLDDEQLAAMQQMFASQQTSRFDAQREAMLMQQLQGPGPGYSSLGSFAPTMQDPRMLANCATGQYFHLDDGVVHQSPGTSRIDNRSFWSPFFEAVGELFFGLASLGIPLLVWWLL